MGTSTKHPSALPNWEFFNLCRRMRCVLLHSIATNQLLAGVSQRMTPAIKKDLEEKGALGKLCFGNSLSHVSMSIGFPTGGQNPNTSV